MTRQEHAAPFGGQTVVLVEAHLCPLCGFPTHTLAGAKAHLAQSHGPSSLAERNWSIYTAYTEDGWSVREICEIWSLSRSNVSRIIQRGLAYPGIFELASEI